MKSFWAKTIHSRTGWKDCEISGAQLHHLELVKKVAEMNAIERRKLQDAKEIAAEVERERAKRIQKVGFPTKLTTCENFQFWRVVFDPCSIAGG